MGLDQYLSASLYISSWGELKGGAWILREVYGLDPEGIRFRLASWRKCNQIHKWFVDNVQSGVDDCKEYSVSRKQLQDLYNLCCKVLKKEVIPEEGLPTQAGFFFGDTAYDKGYLEDIKYTKRTLKKILGNKVLRGMDFYYSSSW